MRSTTTTLKTINAARNALRRRDTVKAQALLTRAANELGMGWLMWSSPMTDLTLTGAAIEMLKELDATTEPQVSES